MEIKNKIELSNKRTLENKKEKNSVITMLSDEEIFNQLKNLTGNEKLYGYVYAVKDNISTKNIRTTAGSRILENYYPVFNATVIEKLIAAGAIYNSKSTMDELGMGGLGKNIYFGDTKNALDNERLSYGSSSGSAVLVANGAVDFALGTDTGDSIRKPAGYNGIIGIKPTYGRVSRYGVIPYASSLDHVGLFARNIETVAKVLEVISGRDDKDMTSSYKEVPKYFENLNSNIEGKKVAVFKSITKRMNNEEYLSMFNKLIENLKNEGAIITEFEMEDNLLKAMNSIYRVISNAESSSNSSNLVAINFGKREKINTNNPLDVMKESRTKGFSSNVKKRFVIGSYSLFQENQEKIFSKAKKIRKIIVDKLEEGFKNFDFLIVPTSEDIVEKFDELKDIPKFSDKEIIENNLVLANFSGYPSITMPLGYINNMPIGVNITTRPFEEQQLLNMSKKIEEILDFKYRFKGLED